MMDILLYFCGFLFHVVENYNMDLILNFAFFFFQQFSFPLL